MVRNFRKLEDGSWELEVRRRKTEEHQVIFCDSNYLPQ